MFIQVLATALTLAAATEDERQTVVLVVGAPGEDAYGDLFGQWASRWEEAAGKADAQFVSIGRVDPEERSDKQLLRAHLEGQLGPSHEPLWLVLIGHGTFDGRVARFNLRGPDVSARELSEWLQPCERPLAILNCASASGPFINRLSAPRRVIVTATKSGFEYNFARFGSFLSEAIQEPSADLDKDDQTSLLEAFLWASAGVQRYYEQDARLATEHALVDDNGDGRGTPADWFQGVRVSRKAKDGVLPDGGLAGRFCLIRSEAERQIPVEMRARRDALELELERIRQTKQERSEDAYYGELETVLLKLSQLYAELEKVD